MAVRTSPWGGRTLVRDEAAVVRTRCDCNGDGSDPRECECFSAPELVAEARCRWPNCCGNERGDVGAAGAARRAINERAIRRLSVGRGCGDRYLDRRTLPPARHRSKASGREPCGLGGNA